MKAPQLLRSGAGLQRPYLRAYRDRADRYHFALAPDSEDSIRYWREAAHWLLHGSLPPTSAAFLLGSMILFDGLTTEADLSETVAALADAYTDHEGFVCVEWRGEGDLQQRRRLSSVTVMSLAKQTGTVSFGSACAELLRTWPNAPLALSVVLERVGAAMVLMLSGDLSAHVIGQVHLTAVHRTCLVRKASLAAISRVHYDQTTEVAPDPVSLSLLDALHADSGRQGGRPALLDHLVEACRPDPEAFPGAAQQRNSSLARLRALAPAAEADGPWSAFLLMVALQLVRVGTRYKSPLAARTIEEYVALAIPRVGNRLRGIGIEDAEQIDWRNDVYDPVLNDPTVSPSQLGKLAAALSAVHDVAVSVLGATPLSSRLSPELPDVRVAAHVIWPHEVDTMMQWLGTMPEDDRLAAQAQAMLALLSSAACRYEDTQHVHMFCVRMDDAVLRISIDPLPSAGSGKTAAARRTIDVRDPQLIAVLTAWVERRRTEGAMPKDLLFGDPEDGRRAFRRGASLGLLNAVLKGATGDPQASTHDLRHSFLSHARASASVLDQKLIDHMSASAGHEWTATTLKIYCHLYEKPLRAQLDSQMHKLSLTERAACRLIGIPPGRLRKRRERMGCELSALCWSAVEDASRTLQFPSVSSGFEVDIPLNPFAPTQRPPGFGTFFSILTDLAAERSPNEIVLRQGVPASLVDAVTRALKGWPSGFVTTSQRIALPWKASWVRSSQLKWLAVRRQLEMTMVDEILPVVDSWAQVATPLHFNLQALDAADPLLYWLSKAGFEGSQFVVYHDPSIDPHGAVARIEDIFGQAPHVHQIKPRRGRSRIYLSVQSADRADASRPPPNAATSVVGLQILMFTAWVWTRIESGHHG